ncbi:MAG TPA: hypothetical protein VEL47_02595 [Myxococcota bacterium]|nr:hypothetical protein [Myxococcota bacterium]
MKSILDFLTMLSLGRIYQIVAGIIKRYFIASYIDFIDHIRGLYFALIFTSICLMLGLSGFILLHAALFLYLPWTNENKIVLMFILGTIYLIVPAIITGLIHSRKRWLKHSGAQKMLEDLSKKEQ